MSGVLWSALVIAGVFGVLWLLVRLGVLVTRYVEQRPRRRWMKRPTVKNRGLWQ